MNRKKRSVVWCVWCSVLWCVVMLCVVCDVVVHVYLLLCACAVQADNLLDGRVL